MPDPVAIGVDIGGSHISAALVATGTPTLMENTFCRRTIDAGAEAKAVIASWADVIRKTLPVGAAWPVVGIAIPGPFDYKRGISLVTEPGKYDSLLNLNVRELLAVELKTDYFDIVTMNDAACFLKGEVLAGAAVNCRRAIGVTLGTGLGTAWYAGRKAEDADRWNKPYGTSIAEDYLSARWLLQQGGGSERTGGVAEMAKKAMADAGVRSVFDEFGTNLGIFLSEFAREASPEVIVIGGNISHAAELFFPAAERALIARSITAPLRKARLGEQAAILGAAVEAITIGGH
jgi:glucokinase